MDTSHRRPLVAYVLVTVAGAVVAAQGLAGVGLIPPTISLDLGTGAQPTAGGLAVDRQTSAPSAGRAGSGSPLAGISFDDDTLALASADPGLSTLAAPGSATSATDAGNGTVTIRAEILGGGSGSGGSDDHEGSGSAGQTFGGPAPGNGSDGSDGSGPVDDPRDESGPPGPEQGNGQDSTSQKPVKDKQDKQDTPEKQATGQKKDKPETPAKQSKDQKKDKPEKQAKGQEKDTPEKPSKPGKDKKKG